MATAVSRNPIVRSYWRFLNNLRPNVKVELVKLLVSSLAHEEKSPNKYWADKYYGAWEDDKDPDEMIEEIRVSRVQGTRKIVSLD